jgi:hypothetical protein
MSAATTKTTTVVQIYEVTSERYEIYQLLEKLS